MRCDHRPSWETPRIVCCRCFLMRLLHSTLRVHLLCVVLLLLLLLLSRVHAGCSVRLHLHGQHREVRVWSHHRMQLRMHL